MPVECTQSYTSVQIACYGQASVLLQGTSAWGCVAVMTDGSVQDLVLGYFGYILNPNFMAHFGNSSKVNSKCKGPIGRQ